MKYSKEEYEIFIFGFSYGGSIAARIAEILNRTNKPHPNIHIHTFGSIYVPSPERVKGINLTSYMYLNDVALKCNGLDRYKDEHVVWLRRPNFKTPTQIKKTLFGTEEEWESHNSYSIYPQRIINCITTRKGCFSSTKVLAQ